MSLKFSNFWSLFYIGFQSVAGVSAVTTVDVPSGPASHLSRSEPSAAVTKPGLGLAERLTKTAPAAFTYSHTGEFLWQAPRSPRSLVLLSFDNFQCVCGKILTELILHKIGRIDYSMVFSSRNIYMESFMKVFILVFSLREFCFRGNWYFLSLLLSWIINSILW